MDKDALSPTFIRLRIFALILLALAPVIAIVLYSYSEQRKAAILAAERDANALASQTAIQLEQVTEGARQLLIAMTVMPRISDFTKPDCSTAAQELLASYRRYLNFGVADINGDVVCSALEIDAKVNVSDRPYFSSAVKSKSFSIGEYTLGKITQKPSLTFGYPLIDDEGEVEAVVFTTLDIFWLDSFGGVVSKNDLIETLTILDRNGLILYRFPSNELYFGKQIADESEIGQVYRDKEHVGRLKGVDDVERLYAFVPVGEEDMEQFFVGVGINEEAAYRSADLILRRDIVILAAGVIFVLLLGFYTSNVLIVKQIELVQRLDKLKSEFVSIASHELRTPLTAIKGFISMMREGDYGKVGKNLESPLEDIYVSSERLIRLVNDLLNLSRIEQGRLKFTITEADIKQICEETVEGLLPVAKEKGLKLTVSVPSKMIVCDSDKAKEVLNNLIGNSIKFTEKGEIKVGYEENAQFHIVCVSDNGIGIPLNDQRYLFQKFHQINSSQLAPTKGTGLGLYISRALMQKIGGDLWLKFSEPGKGSVFCMSFPKQGTKLSLDAIKTIDEEARQHGDQKELN